MLSLPDRRFRIRIAETAEDLAAARKLRALCFCAPDLEIDADAFDAICTHFLIEDWRNRRLVCCFRILSLNDGREIGRSYSAQFYDLAALAGFPGRMLEMGRFCIAPGAIEPDILRLAWAALTAWVDRERVELLFGCSSFRGTEVAAHLDAFALLRERHLAPFRWVPQVKAPEVFPFARQLHGVTPDPKAAALAMPPLLRSYLAMGGWVSDHAVVDRELGTIHVFTGLEVARVPPARARALRAVVT